MGLELVKNCSSSCKSSDTQLTQVTSQQLVTIARLVVVPLLNCLNQWGVKTEQVDFKLLVFSTPLCKLNQVTNHGK